MKRAIKASMIAISTLIIAMLAANLAFAATSVAIKTDPASTSLTAQITATNGLYITPEQAQNPEQLKKLIPATAEAADRNIYPIRTRFLLYTYDGVHVMWGVYGRGYFVGTDNLGKRCWGVYGRGVFAGFYCGEFFWGKYYNGAWKAQGLFGLAYSSGKYVTFPHITVSNVAP